MRLRVLIALLIVVVIFIDPLNAVGPKAPSQTATSPTSPQLGRQERRDEPAVPPDIEKKMAQERSKSRYQSLKRDSEKLLELATELKQYVDKSGENVLSMDVIKKCDEIEKLSKSVRGKMKGE